MKNKNIIISTVILLFFLILIIIAIGMDSKEEKLELSNDSKVVLKNAEREAKSVRENQKKEFNYINVDEFAKLYAANDKSLVLLSKDLCNYCDMSEAILQSIMKKYKIDINYLSAEEMNEDEEAREKFTSLDPMFSNGYNTPVLFLVGRNSIINLVDGLTDRAHYIEFFKYIKYIDD